MTLIRWVIVVPSRFKFVKLNMDFENGGYKIMIFSFKKNKKKMRKLYVAIVVQN